MHSAYYKLNIRNNIDNDIFVAIVGIGCWRDMYILAIFELKEELSCSFVLFFGFSDM